MRIAVLLLLAPLCAAAVEGGGRVELNLRLNPDGGALLDLGDTGVFGGWVAARFGDAVSVRGAADLRLHGAAPALELEDTQSDTAQALSWRLHDAWMQLSWTGALSGDVRLGVQKVRWGVADGIHVADAVSPRDLENPLSLDGRLGAPMASVAVHRGSVQLQLIAAPFFFPAALPRAGLVIAPTADDVLDQTFDEARIDQITYRVAVPDADIAEIGLGARLSWTPGFGDLAVSWFRGRDSLPQGGGQAVITGFQTDQKRVDVAVPLEYPLQHVIGVEYRGELFWEIGGWVEGAVIFPDQTTVTTSRAQIETLVKLGTLSELPDPLPSVQVQDGEPIVKVIVGLDRTFGPVSLSAQWLHGFMTERQMSDVRDYGFFVARWSILDNLALQGGCLTDFDGWLATGALTWLYADALELGLGVVWNGGGDDSALRRFDGLRHVSLNGRVRF